MVITAPDTIVASARTLITARLVDSAGSPIPGGRFVFTVEEGAQYASVTSDGELAGAPFVTFQPRNVRVAAQVTDLPDNVAVQERIVSKNIVVLSRIASMRALTSNDSLFPGDTARLSLSLQFRLGAETAPPRDLVLWYSGDEFLPVAGADYVVARVMPTLASRTVRVFARTEGVVSDSARITLVPPPPVARFQVRTVPEGLTNTFSVGTSRTYEIVLVGVDGAVLPATHYARADLLSQDFVTGITGGKSVFCEVAGVSEVRVFYPAREGETPTPFSFSVMCVP